MQQDCPLQKVPLRRPFVDAFLILAVGIPPAIMIKYATPYQRGFYCSDTSIRYPFIPSTVSSAMLYSIGYGLPVVIIIAVELIRIYYFEKQTDKNAIKPCLQYAGVKIPPIVGRVYYFVGYFLLGAVTTICVTNIGKYTIGRLRPNFIDVCRPDWSKISCDLKTFNETSHQYIHYGNQYITDAQCSIKKGHENEVRVSFPSGHTSFSCFAMLSACIYLHCRASAFLDYLLTPAIQVGLMTLALLTALSRVQNNKHHPSDVIFGAILGLTLAVTFCVFVGKFHNPPPFISNFRMKKRWWFEKGTVVESQVLVENGDGVGLEHFHTPPTVERVKSGSENEAMKA